MKTIDRVREAFDTSPFEDPGCAFGFTEAVAAMLDAAHGMTSPREMQRHFQLMWQAYAQLYCVEHSAALLGLLGEGRYEQLLAHEDTIGVSRQILDRIRETFGGMRSWLVPEDLDVTDILEQAGIT